MPSISVSFQCSTMAARFFLLIRRPFLEAVCSNLAAGLITYCHQPRKPSLGLPLLALLEA